MFSSYPESLLVHPRSDPNDLMMHLGKLEGTPPIHAAHACLDKQAWAHLEAMAKAGFDLAGNHTLGTDADTKVEETLVHRCLRLHLYDDLAVRLENLLALGADPHSYNGQGLSVLGLLCMQSKDLPPHRTQEAYEVLKRYGVRMSDPCSNGKGVSRYLLSSSQARLAIKTRCPELEDWANACFREEKLEARLPVAPCVPARRF